ncbi:18582_t:CDS:2, partial [Racocetra fulgida]
YYQNEMISWINCSSYEKNEFSGYLIIKITVTHFVKDKTSNFQIIEQLIDKIAPARYQAFVINIPSNFENNGVLIKGSSVTCKDKQDTYMQQITKILMRNPDLKSQEKIIDLFQNLEESRNTRSLKTAFLFASIIRPYLQEATGEQSIKQNCLVAAITKVFSKDKILKRACQGARNELSKRLQANRQIKLIAYKNKK